MADDKEKKKAPQQWWEKHYLLKMKTRHFTDFRKFVDFKNGRGILDMESFLRYKPHFVAGDGKGNLIPSPTGPKWNLEKYVAYFEKHGCTVEPITAARAKELRDELENEPIMRTDRPDAVTSRAKPADVDPAGDEILANDESGTEKTFVCGACKAEFDAVDVGVSPIDCAKCGAKAATVKVAKRKTKSKKGRK